VLINNANKGRTHMSVYANRDPQRDSNECYTMGMGQRVMPIRFLIIT